MLTQYGTYFCAKKIWLISVHECTVSHLYMFLIYHISPVHISPVPYLSCTYFSMSRILPIQMSHEPYLTRTYFSMSRISAEHIYLCTVSHLNIFLYVPYLTCKYFSMSRISPELGTFKWDSLNPDQLINLEINNKRRTSYIKS